MTRAEKIERLIARGNSAQLIDYVTDNEYLFKSLINTYIAGPNRLIHWMAGPIMELPRRIRT
jgi:hypothetical protein